MKDITYIRCSTEEQAPELQLADINESFPASNSAIVLKDNISAWKEGSDRPGYNEVVHLIKTGKVKVLYVWNLDRIHRNRKKLVAFFSLCKVYKVKVKSHCQKWLEDINNTPDPFNEIFMDFFINILGWIAEGESNDKSARIKMATVTKKDGTYSYKGNRWGRKAFPTNTINRVLQHHKDGLTIREIAATVLVYDKNNNARNISKSAVHKILATNAVEKDSLFHNPLIK